MRCLLLIAGTIITVLLLPRPMCGCTILQGAFSCPLPASSYSSIWGFRNLVWSMAEVDLAQYLRAETEVVAVAICTQDSPHRVQTTPFDEEGMQEEEAGKGQPCAVDSLQMAMRSATHKCSGAMEGHLCLLGTRRGPRRPTVNLSQYSRYLVSIQLPPATCSLLLHP